MLVEGLPLDSVAHRRDPRSRGWSDAEFLLADVADLLNALLGVQMATYSGAKTFETPKPRERPGDEARRAETRRIAEKHIRRVREIERIMLGR